MPSFSHSNYVKIIKNTVIFVYQSETVIDFICLGFTYIPRKLRNIAKCLCRHELARMNGHVIYLIAKFYMCTILYQGVLL